MINMDAGYSAERTKIILEWIGNNKKVLDLGCYEGKDSELILKNRNEVYGIERMKEAAKKAQKKGIKIFNFDLDKKNDWDLPMGFFDVVLAGEIIEHVYNVDGF